MELDIDKYAIISQNDKKRTWNIMVISQIGWACFLRKSAFVNLTFYIGLKTAYIKGGKSITVSVMSQVIYLLILTWIRQQWDTKYGMNLLI